MKSQRGGFLMGLIVGVLIGLALALAVALYVTKVPIPFINKVPNRDARETEKNKDWDPNNPLAGKPRPAPSASGSIEPARPAPAPAVAPAAPAAPTAPPPLESRAPFPDAPPASAQRTPPARDPAAILDNREPPRAAAPAPAPAPAATPAPARAEAPAVAALRRDEPFAYYVQAGAFGRSEEAEQQRAKLAMLGMESRVTEREQAGRAVFRVRVGPFNQKEQADRAKERLEGASIEAALVRVQK